MSPTAPHTPRRSPGFNGLVVAAVVLLFVVVGAYVWMRWSAGDDTAVDDSRGTVVQPADLPPPDAGAVPATPGATGTGDAVQPQDQRGLSPAEGLPER